MRRTLDRDAQRLTLTGARLHNAPALLVERKRASVDATAGRLRALSPKATLQRGYAIVRADAKLVASSKDVAAGMRVDVELAEGAFGARVEDVT